MKLGMPMLLAAALAARCAQPTPQTRILNDAAQALGGEERIAQVKTLSLEGEGLASNLLQNFTPEADHTFWQVTEYREDLDLANRRLRIRQTRTAQFPFALHAVQRQDESLDGDVAFNLGLSFGPPGPPRLVRMPEAAVRDRRLAMLHHPLTVIRAALDAGAKVSDPRQHGQQQVLDLTTAKGDQVTLAIDSATHLPASVTSMTYHAYLGDVAIETSFSGYEEVGGLKLPKRLTSKIDKYPLLDLRATRNVVNGEVGDLAAPAQVTSASPLQPPPVDVDAQQVGKGIWWLAGGGFPGVEGHRSVLFEFDDHLMLFEVPLSEARTLAVIEKARALVPRKPLTHAIVSHHHPDHAGGLRAAVSEGLTIVTHRANTAFFTDLVGRTHSIVKDALARNPKPLKIQPVDDELRLKDKSMEIHLYRVKHDSHIDNMLMAYVPRDRLLVQADLYDATWVREPWAETMIQNIEERKLRVDRHAPIHGILQTHAEVLGTIQAKKGITENVP